MNQANPSGQAEGSIVSEVARVVPHLPKYAKLVWLLLKDPCLPAKQRTALMAAVGYSVSPIDTIPGIIPVIGQLDDLGVVLFTVRWILGSMRADRAGEYLSRSGLSTEILEEDFRLVKRSGARILKRMVALMGVTALWVWGVGRLAARGVLRKLREPASPLENDKPVNH